MSVGGDAQHAANPKLPLWNAICLSYSTWFKNFLDVLRISWLWLAVVGVTSWLQWSWMDGLVANVKQGIPPQMPSLEARFFIYIGGLAWLLGATSIAVAWHRRMILREQPRLSGSNIIAASLWRYVGMGLLVTLISFFPVFLILLLIALLLVPFAGGGPHQVPVVGFIVISVMLMLYVAAIAVVLRLSPLLPARAVGDLDRTFKETWRRTHGNTWRLFWGLLACTLPPMIILQIAMLVFIGFPVSLLLGGEAISARLAITNSITVICYMLMSPIAVSFLSLAYLYFFQRDQIEVFD
jgi:hypothetical protein